MEKVRKKDGVGQAFKDGYRGERGGWIVGRFMEGPVQTDYLEVAMKCLGSGLEDSPHVHPRTTEVNVLFMGRYNPRVGSDGESLLEVDLKEKGDFALIGPGAVLTFEIPEGTKPAWVLVLRAPSIKGDKVALADYQGDPGECRVGRLEPGGDSIKTKYLEVVLKRLEPGEEIKPDPHPKSTEFYLLWGGEKGKKCLVQVGSDPNDLEEYPLTKNGDYVLSHPGSFVGLKVPDDAEVAVEILMVRAPQSSS